MLFLMNTYFHFNQLLTLPTHSLNQQIHTIFLLNTIHHTPNSALTILLFLQTLLAHLILLPLCTFPLYNQLLHYLCTTPLYNHLLLFHLHHHHLGSPLEPKSLHPNSKTLTISFQNLKCIPLHLHKITLTTSTTLISLLILFISFIIFLFF